MISPGGFQIQETKAAVLLLLVVLWVLYLLFNKRFALAVIALTIGLVGCSQVR